MFLDMKQGIATLSEDVSMQANHERYCWVYLRFYTPIYVTEDDHMQSSL